ncbi:MAG: toll/interleukin-1 receptor domain-containing protein [Paracoccaceae bacterium]|nr:toll/interleukin-1 receptor domain-containing protein [Paracoccaceae bacterium]
MKAFLSYSHEDKEHLKKLRKHLAVLLREGYIDEWFDSKLLAGDEINYGINKHLESSTLILLLISPDYLASESCNAEMKKAMERHRSKTARVVPIIVEPCDWQSTEFSNLKALPDDGKPVSIWENKNEAYLDVVHKLKEILNKEEISQNKNKGESIIRKIPVQLDVSRYKVKRNFDEIDCKDFKIETFGIIKNYFKESIAEIDTIENLKGRFNPLSNISFSCTVINLQHDCGPACITVHLGIGSAFGDIYFSFQENALPAGANGWFIVEADEYNLYLKPSMVGFTERPERVTQKEAAELLWTDFVKQAGIECI